MGIRIWKNWKFITELLWKLLVKITGRKKSFQFSEKHFYLISLHCKLMRCWGNLDKEWTEMVLLYPSSSWLIKSHWRGVTPSLRHVRVRSAFCLGWLLFNQTCLRCTRSCQLLITRLKDPHWFLFSSFIYLVNYLGWLFWGWKDTICHVLISACTHVCWILTHMGRGTATLMWHWVLFRMGFHTSAISWQDESGILFLFFFNLAPEWMMRT